MTILSPLTFEQSVTIKARVLNPGGVWSAMRSAAFIVDAVRADITNLVVSGINYRPAAANKAELDAVFTRNDFEFIELLNIGSSRIDLSGVAFVGGIDFRFGDGAFGALSLTPGQRVLVVEDEAAFAFRYGPPAGAVIAGVYGGNLDNDGEQLILHAADLGIIRDFTYNDAMPWPTSADGGGFSLVLIAPDTNPDHTAPLSWRSSVGSGGSPGSGNATSFSSDPGDDDNGDGLSNFLQYGFGGVSGRDSFPQSSLDSYVVANDLLKRLRKRGLKSAAKRFLAVLDGSDALEKALLMHYPTAILQRCQIHKERNLRSYLSKRHHGELTRLFGQLRKAQGKQASREAYRAISDFLEDKNSAALASLQEAGEDQLTALQSLGIPANLNRSLLSTNIIENFILNIRRRMSRVHRWRTATKGEKETMADRYLVVGLTYAQRAFRRTHGYNDLDKLVQALNKD